MPLEEIPLQTKIAEWLISKQVHFNLPKEDLKRLPKSGPFLLVANRLSDGVDEALAYDLLTRQGLTPKVITAVPSACPDFIQPFVLEAPEDSAESLPMFDRINRLNRSLSRPLPVGPVVLIIDFPQWRLGKLRTMRSLEKLFDQIRELQWPIVPLRFASSDPAILTNGIQGRLYNRFSNQDREVEIRVGSTIQLEELQQMTNISQFKRYVQSRIFSLGSSLEVRRFFTLPFAERESKKEPLAKAVTPLLIEDDIRKLTYRNLLASQGPFDVVTASATELPHALPEIGRLREMTFREVGEGTGKSRDLDEHDLYYHQLIIWDREEKKIVGGYRMGMGDQIFSTMGVEGFYVHSLFRIKEGFFPIMVQSVELGRSFVVPEYQRKRLPLFLLWRGILAFLLQNPQYRYLYGPVSVSKHYSNISKSLIVAFIKKYYYDEKLAKFLHPRKPFRAKVEKVDIDLLMDQMNPELRSLDNIIEDIEPAHFRMPVLMRQYIKMNARFISFNVDPNFSDVLDGFILLDLEDLPLSMIEALKQEK